MQLRRNLQGKVELLLSKRLKMEYGLEDTVIRVRLQLRSIVAIEKQITEKGGKFPFALFTPTGCCLLATSSEGGRNDWCKEIAKYIGQDFFFSMTAPPQESFLPHPPAGVIKLHLNPDRRVLLLTVNSIPEDKHSTPVVLRVWKFEDLASFGCTDRLLVIKTKNEDTVDADDSKDYYCFDTPAAFEILAHLKQAISNEDIATLTTEDEAEGDSSSEEDKTNSFEDKVIRRNGPVHQVTRSPKLSPYRHSLLKALDTDRAVLIQSRPRIARYDSIKARRSATPPLSSEDTPLSVDDSPPSLTPPQSVESCPVIVTNQSSPLTNHKKRFSLTINSPLLRRIFGAGHKVETNAVSSGGKSPSPKNLQKQESSNNSRFSKMKDLLSPKLKRHVYKNSRRSVNTGSLCVPLLDESADHSDLSDQWDSASNSDVHSPSASPMFRRKASKSLTDLNTVILKDRSDFLLPTSAPTEMDTCIPESNSMHEDMKSLSDAELERGSLKRQESEVHSLSLVDNQADGGERQEVPSGPAEESDNNGQESVNSPSCMTDTDQVWNDSEQLPIGRVLKMDEDSLSDDTVSPLPRVRHHSFTEMIQGMFVSGISNSRRNSLERGKSPLSSHSRTSSISDVPTPSSSTLHLKDSTDDVVVRGRSATVSSGDSQALKDLPSSGRRNTLRSKSTSVGDIRRSFSPESSVFTFMDSVVEMQEVARSLSTQTSTAKRRAQMERHRSKSTTNLFPRTKSFLTRPLPRAPGERTVSTTTSANTVYENDDSRLYQNVRANSDQSAFEDSQELYENIGQKDSCDSKLTGHYAKLDFSDFVSKKISDVSLGENGHPPMTKNGHPPPIQPETSESVYTAIDIAATEALNITLKQRQAELKHRTLRKTKLKSQKSLPSVGSSQSAGRSIPRAWSTASRPLKHARN